MSTRIILHHKSLTSVTSDSDSMKTLQNINLNWSFDISDAVDTANEKGEWKERQKRHQKRPGMIIFSIFDSGF